MAARKSLTIFFFVCFALAGVYFFVKWQLAAEEAEMTYYGFQLAAAQTSADPGGDCGLLLKRMPGLGDVIERQDDSTVVHRWSTYYRVGRFTKLFYGLRENGHYWADVVCDSKGNIVRSSFGPA
ncbi:MAG: hypothetical protein AB7Q37_17985 [Pyrinomonadaceae bacterium]